MTTFNSQISLLTLRCNSFSYSMFYEISLKMKTRHHLVEMHQFVNPLTREMLAMYVSAKLRICCNFTFFLMLQLHISSGSIFSWILCQQCIYVLVRCRHKHHFVIIRERSCCWLKIPVLWPQTQLMMSRLPVNLYFLVTTNTVSRL